LEAGSLCDRLRPKYPGRTTFSRSSKTGFLKCVD
jgi:hypothetical protein